VCTLGSFAACVATVLALALAPAAAQASTIGTRGVGAGQFNTPVGVAVNQATGDVYVADGVNQRVEEFDAHGNFIEGFGWGVADGASALETCTTTCQKGLSGGGPGEFSSPIGVAVDQSTGDVYVVDLSNHRVQRFSSSGSFQLMFGGGVNQTTGANVCAAADLSGGDTCGAGTVGTGNGQFGRWAVDTFVAVGSTGTVYVADLANGRVQEFDSSGSYTGQVTVPSTSSAPVALAVNSAGDLYLVEAGVSGVTEYDPSGATLATLDASGFPKALAVDASDEVFVYDGGTPNVGATATAVNPQILKFDSTGAEVADIGVGTLGVLGGVAYDDAASLLYAVDNRGNDVQIVSAPPPGPAASDERATGVLSMSATLNASINPDSHATTFHFEYGTSATYGQSTPESAPIGSDFAEHQVSAALTGLEPGTPYHFRVVATNADGTVDGPDRVFATLPPVVLAAQPAASVTSSSATLQVYANPAGVDAQYHFEYGTSTSYGSTTPSADAGAGTSFALETAAITGLAPATTYHFRAVASNSLGQVDSPDQMFTTPPASCPNAPLRTGASASLPDCRAYEQVSPENKAGYSAGKSVVAASGDRVGFTSQGVFAGNPTGPGTNDYVAGRGSSGWSTAGINPPESIGQQFAGGSNSAADLSESLNLMALGPNTTNINGTTSGIWLLGRTDGSFVQASPTFSRPDGGPLGNVGPGFATADLSHVFFDYGATLSGGTPGQAGGTETLIAGAPPGSVYEVVGAGGPSPLLRLASVDAAGNPLPVCLGEGSTESAEGISADGSRVFFRDSCSGDLLARVDASTTLDLSHPTPNDECTTSACRSAPPAGCAGNGCSANATSGLLFGGQSADGSKVLFLTTRQLTDNASEDDDQADAPGLSDGGNRPCLEIPGGPNGCNLYMYDFGRPAGRNLVDLSAGDTSGVGPQIRSVVRVSDDGSAVYFIAGGLLTTQPNSLGEIPQPGADNLYRYDTSSGEVKFIAELCSGTQQSGSVSGLAQCPGPGSDESLLPSDSDLTPDGRFLVFTSYAQLTPDDTNQAADVYEYDSQTGGLWRVSVGHDGEDRNGNAGGQDAIAHPDNPGGVTSGGATVGLDQRAVSDDGQTIVFTTARPLQSTDTNGQTNVYEWHQGEVTLISGGQSPAGSNGTPVAVTPSGQDIVFETDQGLLPQDTDGLTDIYDARIDGGFPTPPATAPCQGDGCQGSTTPAPALPVAASVGFFGPGNAILGQGGSPHERAIVITRAVRGSAFLVAVKVPGPGRIAISGAGPKTVYRSVPRAGTYRLRVMLTPREKRLLESKRKLKVTLRVGYAPPGAASSSVIVHLTVQR
jgi:hypothetical protein